MSISGYVGNSSRLSSWQERSTDGGRRWIAGPVSRTRDSYSAATTQFGLAFTSDLTGWAFQPSLFFTRDGARSWQPEPGRPASVGPVAVSGSSTWVTGYPCRSADCRPQLLETDRVGAKLAPLPAQPTRTRDIDSVLRPSPTTAWVVTANRHGHEQLVTTADAGHSWQQRSLPCGRQDSFTISGVHPTALYVTCALPSNSMCENCGARVLYRSHDDGADWTRLTPTPTPQYGSRTPSAFIQPTGDHTLWAANIGPIGSGSILRSKDDGRHWPEVLGTAAHPLAIEALAATTPRRAWLVTMTSSHTTGIGFKIYGTTNGGRTWTSSTLPIPKTLD